MPSVSAIPVMSVINCTLINARSLVNKLSDLHHLLYCSQPPFDICFVTESWLNNSISDGILDPQNAYEILRHDRPDFRGGGVCVLVRRGLKFNKININSVNSLVDLISFDLFIDSEIICRFFLAYRPPNSSPIYSSIDAETYCQCLIDGISNNINQKGPSIMLGDLNCHTINWKLNQPLSSGIATLLADFANVNGMTQYVEAPTHNSHILDVVLLNDPLLLHCLSVTTPFSTSDHCSVIFSLCSSSSDKSDRCDNYKTYNWQKADWQGFNDFLSNTDWWRIASFNLTVDSLWGAFRDKLIEGMDLFVPVNNNDNVNMKKYPKFIRQLLSKKSCAWRAMKRAPLDNGLIEKYKVLSMKCRDAIHKREIERELKLIKSDNIGTFYKFVNNKLNHPSGIGVLLDSDNKPVIDDFKKAELLNSYFESVYVDDNGHQPVCQMRASADVRLEDVDFSPQIIHTIIKNLKPKTTCDPEGFPPLLLKKLCASLTAPLSLLFNSFMSVRKIPQAWKTSIIIPIFKKDLPSNPKNYRPVSLTSVFCKLMERVVVKQLLSYLSQHNLITKSQHGFLSRLSTCTNLLECVNDWTVLIESGSQVAVAYVDFARAFDSVTHSKLISKLKSYGITGALLEWIEFYLNDRNHCTRVGGHVSSFCNIRSGVIQGSCIGPILFVLFINDIVDKLCVGATAKLYADDLKLYASINNLTEFSNFQHCLDIIYKWSLDWQLDISFYKCFIVVLCGNHQHVFNFNNYVFKLGSHVLEYKFSARDLGVTVDRKLTFSDHILDIVKKAHQRANLVIRCFHSRDPLSLIQAFKTYVRPLLEYNSQVWSPTTITDAFKIEQVQKQFTKRITGCFDLTYHQRLHKFGLESLELRRLRADLAFTYKLIFGKTGMSRDNFIILKNNIHTLRCHQYQIRPVKHFNTARSSRCLFNRTITLWNSLPAETTDFSSIVKFRNSINSQFLIRHCKLNFT